MATTAGGMTQEQNVDVLEEGSEREAVGESVEASETVIVQQSEVDAVIRKHVYASMALGLAPVPIVDLVGLTAVQVDLVRSLSKKYEVPFKKNLAKTLVGALIGGVLPVGTVPLFASLVKFIPVIGLTTGVVSMSLLGVLQPTHLVRFFRRTLPQEGLFLTSMLRRSRPVSKSSSKRVRNLLLQKRKPPLPHRNPLSRSRWHRILMLEPDLHEGSCCD